MSTVHESSCPACGTVCSLSLSDGFYTSSIIVEYPTCFRAVAVALRAPRILCSVCDLDIMGVYDEDGQHMHFLHMSSLTL